MFSFLVDWLTKRFSQQKKTSPQPEKPKDSSEKTTKPASHFPFNDELQREILAERKFSLAEAIGREGGSFMKGESAVPRPLRAANAIRQFIATRSSDPASALATELYTWSIADIRVSRQLDAPLVALSQIIESLLTEPTAFYEFARRVAIAQSKLTGDRPHFQQPNQPPAPEADYTHDSIKQYLLDITTQLVKVV
ncbi:MAG: hypothetical protein WA949_06020 [Phormidesmis sp.]